MTPKRTIVVVAALVVALLAGGLSYLFLHNAQEQAFKNAKLVPAYVVSKSIPRGMAGADAVRLGFFSEKSVAACVRGAVTMVCIPQRGGSKTPQRQSFERSPAFKQGQRFRAGIEGRISVLMRGRGMKRCRAEGAERFALFVGAAVLANNLMIIGDLMIKRSRRRRKLKRR